MIKRLVAAASVSAVALLGLGSAGASADPEPSVQQSSVTSVPGKIAKPHRAADKPHRAIDWDAPAPSSGEGDVTIQRIDWD